MAMAMATAVAMAMAMAVAWQWRCRRPSSPARCPRWWSAGGWMRRGPRGACERPRDAAAAAPGMRASCHARHRLCLRTHAPTLPPCRATRAAAAPCRGRTLPRGPSTEAAVLRRGRAPYIPRCSPAPKARPSLCPSRVVLSRAQHGRTIPPCSAGGAWLRGLHALVHHLRRGASTAATSFYPEQATTSGPRPLPALCRERGVRMPSTAKRERSVSLGSAGEQVIGPRVHSKQPSGQKRRDRKEEGGVCRKN